MGKTVVRIRLVEIIIADSFRIGIVPGKVNIIILTVNTPKVVK